MGDFGEVEYWWVKVKPLRSSVANRKYFFSRDHLERSLYRCIYSMRFLDEATNNYGVIVERVEQQYRICLQFEENRLLPVD
jgi:plasmid maintenance system killer protein